MYNITKTVEGIPFLLAINSLIGAGQARISLREISRLISQQDLRVLRRLVDRNLSELAEFGDIITPATVATENSSISQTGDVLLNAPQAIYLMSRTATTEGKRLCVVLVKAFTAMLSLYAEHTATGKQPIAIPKHRALPALDVVNPASLLVQASKLLHDQALKIADYEEAIDVLDSRVLALELRQIHKPTTTKEVEVIEPSPPAPPAPAPIPTPPRQAPAPYTPIPKNTSNPKSAARYTIRGWANVHKKDLSDKQAQSLGRRASALCRIQHHVIKKVRDIRWGNVGYYPASVVRAVFAQHYVLEVL